MRLNRLFALLLTCACVASAQSGSYEDGMFLGYKPVANGSNIDVVTGDQYAQTAKAFVIQVGGFQYLILKASDAQVQSALPSPFSFHRDDKFLDNAQPGSALRVRVAGQKIYVLEGSKEHAYAVRSVVPAAPLPRNDPPPPARPVEPGPLPAPANRSGVALPVSPGGYRPQFDDCLRASGEQVAVMLECGRTEQAYQDGRLNGVYQQLLAAESPQAQQQTGQAERQWLAERSRACDSKPSGPGHEIDQPECVLAATKDQANRLQGQLDSLRR